MRLLRATAQGTNAVTAGVLAGGALGALLLFVGEFTTLDVVRTATTTVKTQATGPHHLYAFALVAVLVAALSFGFWRTGSRAALLAIGVLGLTVLVIALARDLPSAHGSGLVGNATTRYQLASATPSAGLYMETLGAVILLITCVSAFLVLGPPAGGGSRSAS